MIIQTERVILRRFKESDIEWYYDFVQDQELIKRLPNLEAKTQEKAEFDLLLYEKGDLHHDYYCVITDKDENVMGVIIAVSIDKNMIDLSYFLKKEYRKNGYMEESLRALIKTVKNTRPDCKFKTVIYQDNIDSLKLVTKLGASIKFEHKNYICYI